jgi:hypothetical protein
MSRSFKSLIAAIALAAAVMFTTLAVAQYLFLTHQLRRKTREDLQTSANVMSQNLGFENTWSLQGYRRTTTGPDIYAIVSETGTVVDVHGYLPGMLNRVSLPFSIEFDRPFTFSSDVHENWHLYVHKLRDGLVILGVRDEIAPKDLERQFAINAARFGADVHDGLNTHERAIHESFDWVIIDSNGTLRWDIGGIPLKTGAAVIPNNPALLPIQQIDDANYAVYVQPVKNQAGRSVGVIRVFQDISGEERVLRESAYFNALVAVCFWGLTVAFAAAFLRYARVPEITCSQIPRLQESEIIEFKSSLRWNYRANMSDPEMERIIVKTVAGFFNSYQGGNLIIGLDDQGNVLGLQSDYSTLGKRPNRDGFEQALRNVLVNAFGEGPCAAWTKVSFCSLQGKELCIVRVKPATEPMYRKEKGSEDPVLYVRLGNTTTPMSGRQAFSYLRERWGSFSLGRFYFRRPVMQTAA